MSPLSAGRDLTVICDEAIGTVMADHDRFKQVLINLMSNAVKFNSAGGSIVVTCKPAVVGRLRVAVTDTGEGIPAELIDRVFVPFDRLDAERTGDRGHWHRTVAEQDLCRGHGRHHRTGDSVGRGSTFWVDLPEAPGGDIVTESGS